jgi:hypothetical protein
MPPLPWPSWRPGSPPALPGQATVAAPAASQAGLALSAYLFPAAASLSGAGLPGAGSTLASESPLDWVQGPRVDPAANLPDQGGPPPAGTEGRALAGSEVPRAEDGAEQAVAPLPDVLPLDAEALQRGMQQFLQGFERLASGLAVPPEQVSLLPWAAVAAAAAVTWEAARRRAKQRGRPQTFFPDPDDPSSWGEPVLEDGR